MKYGFGIDLGGTTVKLAFFNRQGALLDKWEIPTNTASGGSAILPDIAKAVLQYLESHRIPQSDVLGLGIGVPGPVLSDGTVNKCVNLGWGQINIEASLSALTGLPVKAGNDANVAALGEYWQGGGQGFDSMIMVTLGTGVGGGIVLDGKILSGASGSGGEIGHLVLERDEEIPCACGKRGCAEQYLSATGIARSARNYLAADQTPSTLRTLENIIAKDVFDAAAAGDPGALAILDGFYERMAEFVANLCAVINPHAVVIGGGVSKAGQPLLDGISQRLGRYIFHGAAQVQLRLATLGNDAGAYGAFKLILDN